MDIIDAFLPGPARLRGLVQFEVGSSMWELFKKLDRQHRMSPQALPLLQEASSRLEEAEGILTQESLLQEEHQMARQAAVIQGFIRQAFKKCKRKK
ncbi:hypothetical protein FHG87_022379 [Trinorchestia longiramus]|nr:hypothetical protein FHG87_022379 [Trinorchestia longiramus]